jgi:hypothetical protein
MLIMGPRLFSEFGLTPTQFVVGTETENVTQKDFQEGGKKNKKRKSKGRAKSGTLPTHLRRGG